MEFKPFPQTVEQLRAELERTKAQVETYKREAHLYYQYSCELKERMGTVSTTLRYALSATPKEHHAARDWINKCLFQLGSP